MSLISAQVLRNKRRKAGNYVATLRYTFTGNRIFDVDLLHLTLETDASSLLASKGTSVVERVQRFDAEEAVKLSIVVAHREATVKQVYRAWLMEALTTPDSLRAFRILGKVIVKVQDLSLTPAQLATQLEISREDIDRLQARWVYLNGSKVTLNEYSTILEGDS